MYLFKDSVVKAPLFDAKINSEAFADSHRQKKDIIR